MRLSFHVESLSRTDLGLSSPAGIKLHSITLVDPIAITGKLIESRREPIGSREDLLHPAKTYCIPRGLIASCRRRRFVPPPSSLPVAVRRHSVGFEALWVSVHLFYHFSLIKLNLRKGWAHILENLLLHFYSKRLSCYSDRKWPFSELFLLRFLAQLVL